MLRGPGKTSRRLNGCPGENAKKGHTAHTNKKGFAVCAGAVKNKQAVCIKKNGKKKVFAVHTAAIQYTNKLDEYGQAAKQCE